MEQKGPWLAERYKWIARGSFTFVILALIAWSKYGNIIPNNLQVVLPLLILIPGIIVFFYALSKRSTCYPMKKQGGVRDEKIN